MRKVKVLNSLADLGNACGVSTHKKAEVKPRKCFVCGGEMRNIPDTNVFLCTGTKKDKDGKEKPCVNRLIVGVKGA